MPKPDHAWLGMAQGGDRRQSDHLPCHWLANGRARNQRPSRLGAQALCHMPTPDQACV